MKFFWRPLGTLKPEASEIKKICASLKRAKTKKFASLSRLRVPRAAPLVAARRLRNPPRERRQAFSRDKRQRSAGKGAKTVRWTVFAGETLAGGFPDPTAFHAVGLRERGSGKTPCKGVFPESYRPAQAPSERTRQRSRARGGALYHRQAPAHPLGEGSSPPPFSQNARKSAGFLKNFLAKRENCEN